jgi:hypothetical protein
MGIMVPDDWRFNVLPMGPRMVAPVDGSTTGAKMLDGAGCMDPE